jgi:acetate kinase
MCGGTKVIGGMQGLGRLGALRRACDKIASRTAGNLAIFALCPKASPPKSIRKRALLDSAANAGVFAMKRVIAVINAGSSSFKFGVFSVAEKAPLEHVANGAIELLGSTPHILVHDGHGTKLADYSWSEGYEPSTEHLVSHLVSWIERYAGSGSLAAVGHRVVFGGMLHTAPIRIGPGVLEQIETLIPVMPLHLPHNLAPIRAFAVTHPHLPQVACFDTAFHQTIPRMARLFALPRKLTESGIVRYGFHGLSYEHIAAALPDYDRRAAQGRTIVAHLGSGASLCALERCRSVDTTMGFSVLDGLVMGTRSGGLDPGVLLYLLRAKGFDASRLEHLLYEECGLLGVSGLSADMRTLLSSDAPQAQEAVDLFCRRVVSEIGRMIVPLGGFDALVFTGGIGENAVSVRQRVCAALQWLGLSFDSDANARGGPRISTRDSRISAWVVPSNENLMIARHTYALLDAGEG